MGIDKFFWMLHERYLNTSQWTEVMQYKHAADGTITEIHPTAYGNHFISGMHHAIYEMAQQGVNIIADHVFHERAWLNECARLFHGMNAYLIGVYCPLAVLEERERSRKTRTLGQARAMFDIVHAHGVYDLKVDTSLGSAKECAQQIWDFLQKDPRPAAFSTIFQQNNR
jgi:chloramphenicol 3-O-phosphotransferase